MLHNESQVLLHQFSKLRFKRLPPSLERQREEKVRVLFFSLFGRLDLSLTSLRRRALARNPDDESPTASFDFTEGRLDAKVFRETSDARHKLLKTTLDAAHSVEIRTKVPDRPPLVMFFNYGYVYQFLNFLCSLETNLGSEFANFLMETRLIVLASDDNLLAFFRKYLPNVFTIDVRELNAGWFSTFQIDPKTGKPRAIEQGAATAFAVGPHYKLNVVSLAFATDMLTIGRDVVVMDCDFFWTKDAMQYMLAYATKEKLDAVFVEDGRAFTPATNEETRIQEMKANGIVPPLPRMYREPYENPKAFAHVQDEYATYNSGFFYLRSNSKTVRLTKTVMSFMHLVKWKRSDQLLWNRVLHHSQFKDLKLGIVGIFNGFVGGGLFDSSANMKVDANGRRQERGSKFKARTFPTIQEGLVAVHASDVGWHAKKITKFKNVGHWYLHPEGTCRHWKICVEIECVPSDFKEIWASDRAVANDKTLKHRPIDIDGGGDDVVDSENIKV